MNKWLKLSVFSIVGIILSMIILSFISPRGNYGYGYMNQGYAMNNMQSMQGMPSNNGMNMAGGSQSGMGMMNMNSMPMNSPGMMPMGNMQQGGTSSMPMNNMSNMQDNSNMQIMQMLNQLQMEISQLKQQMSGMPSGGSSSGGGMGMM